MSKRTQDYISGYAGNNIRYFPALAHSLHSVNAAVMLSQLMYWQDMGHRHDGFFYKTAQELFYETGLSQDKLNSARKLLVRRGLIDTKLRGIPAKTHYYVNTAEVADMLTTWRKAAPKELRDSLFQIAKKQETITETTQHTTHTQPRDNYQSLPPGVLGTEKHRPFNYDDRPDWYKEVVGDIANKKSINKRRRFR